MTKTLLFQNKPSSSKQMKITSLFSRITNESPGTRKQNNDCSSPNTKSFSSPDVIPPSPVLERKKTIKAKRSLNSVLINDDVGHKNKLMVSKTNSVNIFPNETSNLTPAITEQHQIDKDAIDSQPCDGTESMASTICDETDFCSDLVFDDWIDCSSTALK